MARSPARLSRIVYRRRCAREILERSEMRYLDELVEAGAGEGMGREIMMGPARDGDLGLEYAVVVIQEPFAVGT